VGLKLNETHQLLIYADEVDLMGDNIDTIKKNTETLLDGSKEVGLEVNTDMTAIGSPLYNNTLRDLLLGNRVIYASLQ
jgi:hypothetical protein